MRPPAFIAVLLCTVLCGGRARAAEREERFAFPVQPGCSLKIDSHRGTVVVNESDESVVKILVQMEIGASNDAEAERLRAALQLDVHAAGNVVTIFARNPDESRALWVWREEKQIGLTYRVTVPRRCNADLTVRNGSVTLGSLAGRVRARVETGTISCRQIEGSVDVAVVEGDIVVSRCLGPLTARVQRGTIRTGLVAGRADVQSRSGDVEILLAQGPVSAAAEAGDLTVGFPRAIGGDAKLSTRGGNVVVKIDPAANGRIEASSVWGVVTNRLPLTIESGGSGKSQLTGLLHAGGPRVTARASGGYVRLEPGEPLFE